MSPPKRARRSPRALNCSRLRSMRKKRVEMALHLIKLSVGTDSVEDLQDWIKRKLKDKKKRGVKKVERVHTTRMVPKRVDELLDGGSIYWVIRGQIACRERILAVRPFTDKDGT